MIENELGLQLTRLIGTLHDKNCLPSPKERFRPLLELESNCKENFQEVEERLLELFQAISLVSEEEVITQASKALTQVLKVLWRQGSAKANACMIHRLAEILDWKEAREKGYEFRKEAFFLNHIKEFTRHLNVYCGLPNIRALEIGCMEGMSCCWMLDKVLTAESSRIDCIDPSPNPAFEENIKRSCNAHKVTLHRKTSQEALADFEKSDLFDIVYIDGLHVAYAVFLDLLFSWQIAAPNALIIIDDYRLSYDISGSGQLVQHGADLFLSLLPAEEQPSTSGGQVLLSKAEISRLDVGSAARRLTDFFLPIYSTSGAGFEEQELIRATSEVREGMTSLWNYSIALRNYIMIDPLRRWSSE